MLTKWSQTPEAKMEIMGIFSRQPVALTKKYWTWKLKTRHLPSPNPRLPPPDETWFDRVLLLT
jgi:hypothetical protein